jgi:hypothetical protein
MILNESLLETKKKFNQDIYQVIQSMLFMVAYSSGLGIMGSTYTLIKFGIDSLIACILLMIFVLLTYLISNHMMVYCIWESSKDFNFAEYLEDRFGKFIAITYDILLSIHNLILITSSSLWSKLMTLKVMGVKHIIPCSSQHSIDICFFIRRLQEK